MVQKINRKFLFNLSGTVVVAFWLLMLVQLIKKQHFTEPSAGVTYNDGIIAIESAEREWKEIFLDSQKIGYSVNLIRPFQDGYFVQEEIFFKINLLGMGRGVHSVTQTLVDDKFILKSFNLSMNSGVVRYNVSGKVEANRLIIETGKGRDRRSQAIELSEPPMISASLSHIFKTRKVKVGDTIRLSFFDPSTMAQSEIIVKVAARESIKINKLTYEAFRMEMEMWGSPITFWIDEHGKTLKEEGFMGLTTIRSSAAKAPYNIQVNEEDDFYDIVAIKLDNVLSDPRNMSYLKLKVAGIDDTDQLYRTEGNHRQIFRDGVLEIKKEALPSMGAYNIPYSGSQGELAPFLIPEFNVESDAQEIIDMARRIAKDDRDPVSVAGKMQDWVFNNLEKKPVLTVPSALEVLRTRVGDCNEHATLLAALLRASGIPARLSIGLVYTRNRFYYHAWTEGYVGKWVSMDATMNQIPTDATHIMLMYGNLDKQVAISGLIGKLELEVLDFGYN